MKVGDLKIGDLCYYRPLRRMAIYVGVQLEDIGNMHLVRYGFFLHGQKVWFAKYNAQQCFKRIQ